MTYSEAIGLLIAWKKVQEVAETFGFSVRTIQYRRKKEKSGLGHSEAARSHHKSQLTKIPEFLLEAFLAKGGKLL